MSSPWIAWFRNGARSSRTTASASANFTSVRRFTGRGRRSPAQDWPARGGHFVHFAGARQVRRRSYQLWIGLRFPGDRDHRADEGGELLLALRFGWLDLV